MVDEYIEVNNFNENPEYPTRVRIIGYDGTFEHAGDYTAPYYSFSVQVEIKYNKVVDGQEKNILTCTFWTKEDTTAPFSFEDDELTEEEVDDWFWEGLGEDLSFHDLEGLEDLDFYALGVPTCDDDAVGNDVDSFISSALNECIPDKWDEFELAVSDLYNEPEKCPDFSKETEIINGDNKTVLSIEDFELERDENSIDVSFSGKAGLYLKDDLICSFDYEFSIGEFMDACHNLYPSIVSEIESMAFEDLVDFGDDGDLSVFCGSFDRFKEAMRGYDSFEDCLEEYLGDSYYCENITVGPVLEGWIERLDS